MTLDDAVNAVIQESNRPYAITYAKALGQAIWEATEMGMDPNEGARMQIPYILSNLGHWRGERAREVKAALKESLNELG